MARYRRRLCLAVDLRRYSHHSYAEQQDAQYRLRLVVEHALRRARVLRVRVQQQLQGDGQLIVFPARLDLVRTVPALVLGLRDGLYRANSAPGSFGRLQMRAALGRGEVSRADRGYVGDCVVRVGRLVDSDAVRQALERDSSGDLALAVTDELFQDVILPRAARELSPLDFHPVDIAVEKKDFSSGARLYVPESAPAPDTGADPVVWGHSRGRVALREFVVPALAAAYVAATLVSRSETLREWVLTMGTGSESEAGSGSDSAEDPGHEGFDEDGAHAPELGPGHSPVPRSDPYSHYHYDGADAAGAAGIDDTDSTSGYDDYDGSGHGFDFGPGHLPDGGY